MKTTIRNLKKLIREASRSTRTKNASVTGITDDKIVNPNMGFDLDQVDNAKEFVRFMSRLAQTAKEGQKLVIHGSGFTYMIDPRNFLNVTVSDGSPLKLQYLSDLGNYDSSIKEIMFDIDPDYFDQYVSVSKPRDQEEHEFGRLSGDW